MNAASAGKWTAVALFSFVAVLVVIAAVAEMGRQAEAKRSGPAPVDYPFDLDVTATGTIPQAEFIDPGSLTDGADAIQSVDDWTWTSVEESSGRVRYEIKAEHVDPEAGGRIILTKPRALVFLGSTTARVSAATGEIIQAPGQQDLESGKLSGGVNIEFFEVGDTEDREAQDLDTLEPSGVLQTESIFFETALGQIETPDALTYESEGVSFAGRGLLVRVGELERGREYRLSILRIEESSGVRIRPGALSSNERRSRNKSGTDEPAPAIDEPKTTTPGMGFYRASVKGGVEIAQAGRRITADRMDAFARLFGGKLAPSAITKLALPARTDPPPPDWEAREPNPWSESFVGTPEEPLVEEDALDQSDQEILLTWGGTLEIRPESTEPAELLRDDVFVHFSAPNERAVEITDLDSGANARCESLMYGLTSARLLLTGAGIESAGVQLEAPGVGRVTGNSLEMELADLPLGVVRMRSPGAASAESENPRTVSWKDSAEIGFEVIRDAGGTGPLRVLARSIGLAGEVEAIEGANVVRASSGIATFRDRTDSEGTSANELAELHLDGQVRATTEDGGTLEAEHAEIRFARSHGSAPSLPVEARARGAVHVERDGDWLEAEHLDTWFTTDEAGRLRVSRVEGATGVSLGTDGGFGASTELLKADLDAQSYELSGDTTEVFHHDGTTRYGLSSASMRIDGTARTLVTFGRGQATYSMTPPDAPGDSGHISWTGSMFYDDPAGIADIIGDVVASRIPGPLERQHAEADRVQLRLTPWTDAGEEQERRVLAIDLEADEGAEALMELRRYRTQIAEGDAELETLVALRAETIGFDAVSEVLDIPHPGLLLVEDRRRGEVDEGKSARTLTGDTEVRGTTAFQWERSLRFERRTGHATMNRNVRVRHLGLETGRLIQLECEKLDARFLKPGDEHAGASPLLGVLATDGVFLSHDTVEVICDQLNFDALNEQVYAEANPGNRVTVLNSADGGHFTAVAVVVDLPTGEWRAQKATGIRVSE